MQNQITPKQSARATQEETRKRDDQIKTGKKAQRGFKYNGNMKQVGNGHTIKNGERLYWKPQATTSCNI
jgi:hypothetical protein